MKRSKAILLFLMIIMMTLTGCLKPQEFDLRTNNTILSISLAYKADPLKTYQPVIFNLEAGEIHFKIPPVSGGSFSKMKVFITVPSSALILPAFTGVTDLSKPYRFSVIAESGAKKEYLLVVYN